VGFRLARGEEKRLHRQAFEILQGADPPSRHGILRSITPAHIPTHVLRQKDLKRVTGHKKPVGQAWHSKAQFESAYRTFDGMAVVLAPPALRATSP
jgi:hypothetical protein